ncbi:pleckstrin homology domain-containing family A member 4-like isoform X1 [Entelurus aequoreus]|uniref:pleckstrin homology domain-containing family A member 4-like isoform X1 n=1 Tax=Entelurus aequoreus TaxID=161455 RepID=UPI002B1D519B|nr:pleckstrin homology domain-containing family A member 4-like isoform X1 [Entelurus aequoreus]
MAGAAMQDPNHDPSGARVNCLAQGHTGHDEDDGSCGSNYGPSICHHRATPFPTRWSIKPPSSSPAGLSMTPPSSSPAGLSMTPPSSSSAGLSTTTPSSSSESSSPSRPPACRPHKPSSGARTRPPRRPRMWPFHEWPPHYQQLGPGPGHGRLQLMPPCVHLLVGHGGGLPVAAV